jgi:hypothetical protein
MKTLAVLGVAALAIACDSTTSPRVPLNAPTTLSSAVLTNDRVEIQAFVLDACNGGGVIPLTATVHSVFGTTSDGAGGFHLRIHDNISAQGSDPVTGVGYVLSLEADLALNVVAGKEQTITEHFSLIAKGNTPNEVGQVDMHVTVTPNGAISSSHDRFRVTCQ